MKPFHSSFVEVPDAFSTQRSSEEVAASDEMVHSLYLPTGAQLVVLCADLLQKSVCFPPAGPQSVEANPGMPRELRPGGLLVGVSMNGLSVLFAAVHRFSDHD